MSNGQRSMMREAGTAFAVLAIYVLTLLLPLHQAAGLQRDLNAIGFSTLDNWSVCQKLVVDDHGRPDTAAAVKCPVAGVAKQGFGAVLPPILVLSAPAEAAAVAFLAPLPQAPTTRPDHFGQSRAPPRPV